MKQKNRTLEPDWGIDIGKPPQLEIRFVEVRGNVLYVLGVAHSAIKVGDRFRKLSQFAAQSNTQDTLGEDLAAVKLRVKSITAYHNQLNRVNADMTAALELIGDWGTLLAILADNGWSNVDDSSHQWRDSVLDSEKLILSK